MNFESSHGKERAMHPNLETLVDGTYVIVTNHALGYSRTYRDGMCVSTSGAKDGINKNNIASMDKAARDEFAKQQKAA